MNFPLFLWEAERVSTSLPHLPAGKMLLESRVLLSELKEELQEHSGSRQAKSSSQESKQLSGQLGGEEELPSLLSYRGFYPLKMGGTNMGSRKMWFFSHWLCPITYIHPCPIGILGVGMSRKSHGFFALFFP